MFFQLPHRCTIKRATKTTARSGQKEETWNTVSDNVKCLFYPTTGNRNTDTLVQYERTGELYLQPNQDILEGDKIYLVSGKGNFKLASGIFLVIFIRPITNFDGRGHHLTVKIRGLEQ